MNSPTMDRSQPLLQGQLIHIRALKDSIQTAQTIYEKLEILDSIPTVEAFFSTPSLIKSFLSGLSIECEYVIKSVFAIDQSSRVFLLPEGDPVPKLRVLLDELLRIETFYADIGGIIGYQYLALTLLQEKKEKSSGERLLPPERISIIEETAEVKEAIIEGIKQQGQIAEIYPVGGAADRLQLKDEKSEEGLPAARLVFLGKPLLEGVIGDLQAREYLHYKLFDQQVVSPVAMMTSSFNRNEEHIRFICEKNNWFGREKESFRFVSQPAVPAFTREGNWCLQKPLKLLLKPGGHGMLWKLLKQKGVFEWLALRGCKKALIRQINNPMAAIDYGLLAFLGLGHLKNRAFGFASCPRLVNAHEGMNVVKITEKDGGSFRALTNIEYCDFEKFGVEDRPQRPGSSYSLFPSNTNILFADLQTIDKVVENHPFPGLLVNFRKAPHLHSKGENEEVARLETTMQNIADYLEDKTSYLTFNERRKTISTTKRKSTEKGALLETPEGCYYDFMLNSRELLEKFCDFSLPLMPNEKSFTEVGPSFLFSYHPALGPLYSVIGQKIQKGRLEEGAELQLEIADLRMENLGLEGSLLIHAQRVMGHLDTRGLLQYSNQTGQCLLKNVRVKNKGIDWEKDHLFWKHDIKRLEAFKIVLHGHSQFIAEDITIEGDLSVEVPHGMRMIAKKEKGKVVFITEPLKGDRAFWDYSIDEAQNIKVKKVEG